MIKQRRQVGKGGQVNRLNLTTRPLGRYM